jgi:putative ATP-binding cassette transporter
MTKRASTADAIPLSRETWRRLGWSIVNFARSEVGGRALALFALLIFFLLAINGLNVLNSYVGRDFMTAIAERDHGTFGRQAVRYVGVFALSTIAAVLYRFAEERLGLLWRAWMSRQLVEGYLNRAAYYILGDTVPNPDQRITDDARAFTTTTLSLLLMFLNGVLTIVAFGGVLWTISVPLFAVAVAYAAIGSLLTVLVGRRLVELNYWQADCEANLRSDLTRVRENAESVALLHYEPQLRSRLMRRIDSLVGNVQHIIAVNRNLGFFTTGYNYLIQLIPALIIAPAFMRGEVEFGVITQSTMAFSHLMGAFSLVVTQFPGISSQAALLARLSALVEGVQQLDAGPIEVVPAGDRVAFEALTLRSPRDGRVLVGDLTVTIPHGTRLLVRSKNIAAKVALFRATAGLWRAGTGRIARPLGKGLFFIAERPYVPPSTLREILVGPKDAGSTADERILSALRPFGLETIVVRAGGLDRVQDWASILSLADLQLLCIARLVLAGPRFAFLDRIGTALDPPLVAQVLGVLERERITHLSIGNAGDPLEHYDAILDLGEDGKWTWTAVPPDAPRARTGGG